MVRRQGFPYSAGPSSGEAERLRIFVSGHYGGVTSQRFCQVAPPTPTYASKPGTAAAEAWSPAAAQGRRVDQRPEIEHAARPRLLCPGSRLGALPGRRRDSRLSSVAPARATGRIIREWGGLRWREAMRVELARAARP